jgi:hypothetical protein
VAKWQGGNGRAESASVIASVLFWNSGNVTVLRLELPARRDSVIDDRIFSPAEDVGLLLDSYLRLAFWV